MNKIQSYRDLEVWQKAMQLVTSIYEKTGSFPKEELYGLTSQIRKSAVSIPSNIAEGKSRRPIKEYLRFLNIAYGSLAELETQVIIASNLGYLERTAADKTLSECASIGRMLNGLISKFQNNVIAFPETRNPKPET